MRILVTGAGGFIGREVTRQLLARSDRTDDLVLSDLRLDEARRGNSITHIAGDLADPAFAAELFGQGWDAILHLAATLTLDAERDPEGAYRIGIDPVRAMLDCARPAAGRPPILVYTSSIAVYGAPLPETVDDGVKQSPSTTYGVHKAIVEHLIADGSRRGVVDGRILRLPIVLVRPPTATPTISDRISALVRDRLAERDVVLPLAADDSFPVASVKRVASSLIALLRLPADEAARGRAMNLPGLTVTPAAINESLERLCGDRPLGRAVFAPEPAVQVVVAGWPRRFVSARASALGLEPEPSFDAIVRGYMEGITAGRETG